MADSSITLRDLVDQAGIDQAQCRRESLAGVLPPLREAEVTAQIGAGPHERAAGRTTQRNGKRERPWETRLGPVPRAIPQLRQGTYYPGFLEPRRRSAHARSAVIQEAEVLGVRTRKGDALVQRRGMTGVSQSAGSRIGAGLDERVEALRPRRLEDRYPSVWVDAKSVKVREGDRVVSRAVVVAVGVRADGEREGLGCDVGLSEDAAFGTAFLRSRVARGLHGVRLVSSDAHEGLPPAIQTVPQSGASVASSSWWTRRETAMRSAARPGRTRAINPEPPALPEQAPWPPHPGTRR